MPSVTWVELDVSGLTRPDAVTVEVLARLQLDARRHGRRIRVRRPSSELRELIALFGLTEVLRVEPEGQAEEREQPFRVEERVERGDPTA